MHGICMLQTPRNHRQMQPDEVYSNKCWQLASAAKTKMGTVSLIHLLQFRLPRQIHHLVLVLAPALMNPQCQMQAD